MEGPQPEFRGIWGKIPLLNHPFWVTNRRELVALIFPEAWIPVEIKRFPAQICQYKTLRQEHTICDKVWKE